MYGPLCVYLGIINKEYMMYKNLVVNAFGDTVERTDYGTHKNQLTLFDNEINAKIIAKKA